MTNTIITMATNFDDAILSSNGFSPTKVDTPLDKRSRIENVSEVPNIPNPFVGMIFYVSSEDKYYRVKSLKSKVVGGITVQNAQVNEYVPFETGGSGASSYSDLSDKPSIGGVTLEGNKTLDSLGIASKQSVAEKQDAINKVNVAVGSGTGTPSGSASVSGSTLNISLENIKGQKGDTGATGPSNNITIGTVTPSDSTDEASATITGTAPNQVLNLVLPRGMQGNSGVSGDTSEIAVVNDLNGGESEAGSIKVLAAEQGKVLNEKIKNSSINIIEFVKNILENDIFFITGFGTDGVIGKIKAVGDVYYNTDTKLLRRCKSIPVDGNLNNADYETVPKYSNLLYYNKGDNNVYVLRNGELVLYDIVVITGLGESGLASNVKNIGDIFYNTGTKLLRKANTTNGSLNVADWGFETVGFVENGIYVDRSTNRIYTYIDQELKEVDNLENTYVPLFTKIRKKNIQQCCR